MKRLFFFLLVSGMALSAIAQSPSIYKVDSVWRPSHYAQDALLSHWVVDINLLGGGASQTYTMANSINNYNNAIGSVSNTGSLTFTNGVAYGADAQLAYFFGRSNNFGIGLGFMYLGEQGDATLNQFNVQYESTDSKGQTFRQLITADGPIKEHLNMTNLNIPLLLKYKHRFSYRWGFTADAGALFNVQMKNSYSSNAAFDYEAIYQLNPEGTPVYDAAPTPNVNDILYTKAQYNRVNPPQNDNSYFNTTLRGEGYNVGLGISPNNNKGNVSYTTGSVGLLVQPGVNYYLSDMVALNLGVYFLYQPFSNTSSNTNEMLTNTVGQYSSAMNEATKIDNISYGLNLGVRIYLGKKFQPLVISGEDGMAPSACGLCDGNIVLHDLNPGGPITVNYTKDGIPQPAYSGTVPNDGSVRISSLCSGYYSNVIASNGKQSTRAGSMKLDNPVMRISSQNSTNPTAYNACDGTISFYGLRAGQPVKVSYYLDGASQPTYTGYAGQDGAVTLTHLCGGTYSNISATMGNCSANATDVTLQNPAPPPPPVPVNDDSKVSVPILFEVDKTIIHKSSYPTLIEAAHRLNDDPEAIIIVDGYTDNTGSDAHNRVLSMRRAEAVKKHLEDMGIDAKRIKVQGHAEHDPVAPNDTPENKLKNRRAVMHLSVGDK